MELAILVLAVLAVLWVALSPDRLASTIRVRIKGSKAVAAEAIDDISARLESAIEDNLTQLRKAETALVTVGTSKKAIEAKLAMAKQDSEKWDRAAQNAAAQQEKHLVVQALALKQAADDQVTSLQPQVKLLTGKYAEIEQAVRTLHQNDTALKAKKVELKTRATTAEVSRDVQQLLSTINTEGHTANIERATEMVERLEAQAGAWTDVNAPAMQEEKDRQALEALAKGPQDSLDSQADKLMAQYANKPAA